MTTEPTHYEVLSLPQTVLDDSSREQVLPVIKQAYHRALLQHHPDKAPAAARSTKKPANPSLASSPHQHQPTYTVDQITTAYAILSSPALRSKYDAHLRTAASRSHQSRSTFQTGIETIDLDDLSSTTSERTGDVEWFRPCRCGNERGYLFGEADLEEAGDLGELIVGCQDCSLWLRVCFAVVEEGEDGQDGPG
ncbi:hypothetical protein M406DRAFT_355088 [Cryphonectria parasitica EP155]|uniref:Diphthamide biosynthesis protein 4 n=1 Tax=Cryphonectria parasitica (strain ATCC 38755 / EP155) TaxID=660469 RepID=A0A9P4Y8W3_CRYP1|nr:uncharacterized protein M406DRAFT_355088 [Cryphonectria parasitica EP155]KAF3768943.1 hypothetical protein M406DRAFT_355088 [Cryphonectria parasitica EP155]